VPANDTRESASLPRFTTAKRPAFREQFGADGALNRAIDSASTKKRFVRNVHNGIDFQRGDVAADHFNFGGHTDF
jgi:hypothetical protein